VFLFAAAEEAGLQDEFDELPKKLREYFSTHQDSGRSGKPPRPYELREVTRPLQMEDEFLLARLWQK
jgi:hypothetical protein